jgi:hypothetical protein
MSSNQTVAGATAGKLHLLDLAALKSQMGDRWARMADPVECFFEGAVRRNLGPGDIFFRQGELSYILMFRALSPDEAQLKCRSISEEVSERLFGDRVSKASFRALVMPLPPDALAGAAMPDGLDELLENKGKETIFLATASKDQETSAKVDEPAADTEEPTYFYRPIWDATKNVVVTYLCQSDDDKYAWLIGSSRKQGNPQDRQASVDYRVLRECAARTLQLHRAGLRVLFGVSVALDTLSHARLWISYSRDLQTIAPAVSRDFAFFVTGIDSGVPNIRLAQELPKLTRLSHQIFCVIEDRGYVGTRFSRTGAHAIGIQLSPGEAESAAMGRIVELARQASEAGLAAFVLGVPSTCIMLHALGQGIRYLEGSIIRPAVSDPRHAFAQSLEYVYTSGKNKPPADRRNNSGSERKPHGG